jgi:hypothetical protein
MVPERFALPFFSFDIVFDPFRAHHIKWFEYLERACQSTKQIFSLDYLPVNYG